MDENYQSVKESRVKITCFEGCFDQLKNVFTHYMPILFKENALKTIWARGFVMFHGVQSCGYLCLSDWVG